LFNWRIAISLRYGVRMKNPEYKFEIKRETETGSGDIHHCETNKSVGNIAEKFAEAATDGESLTIVKRLKEKK